ncbi:hypothetical protein D3C71_1108450 [compost metagenome]
MEVGQSGARAQVQRQLAVAVGGLQGGHDQVHQGDIGVQRLTQTLSGVGLDPYQVPQLQLGVHRGACQLAQGGLGVGAGHGLQHLEDPAGRDLLLQQSVIIPRSQADIGRQGVRELQQIDFGAGQGAIIHDGQRNMAAQQPG